ncbi:MAG: hypothetical protein JRG76_10265 [Deltaproteobacteria bacterium]|nr:hypothetical protein [Deltaproteobacteria bacterium]MBW2414880.1 hypothetical protein [Deltaproteobacteria bacterium]
MRSARLRPAVLLLAASLSSACALTPPPHGYPTGALFLAPARPYVDRVNCPRKDCERWFRTRVGEKGDLRASVQVTSEDKSALRYSLMITDREAKTLVRDASGGAAHLEVKRSVPAGGYLVGVVAHKDSRAFDFSVRVDFEPAPPPPVKKKPEFEIHSTPVLESVGYGQDTVAVLIESGEKRGMQVGFRGRLIDDGETIGSIVIEQVFPDGSRAKIEGALSSPVTHATIAEIRVPAGLGIGNAPDDAPAEPSDDNPFGFPEPEDPDRN